MRLLVVIVAFGFLLGDVPSDSTKIRKKIKEPIVKERSYDPIQQQLKQQNLLLDSIILKLKNDTI